MNQIDDLKGFMIRFPKRDSLFTSCKLTLFVDFFGIQYWSSIEIPSWDQLAEHQEAP